jgi:hypothetical protein
MGERQPGSETRYRAFISYSHKDARAASRLHRRLESYRIPRRVAGTEGLHGSVPTRLTPIFRDREDLPAAGDLSETVRAALVNSAALVVIGSSHAAASRWVAREIALFRALHPDSPIYAAIVEGEPAEAFPAELTAGGTVEPLAADLRGSGDGRRLGFLKLAAGLAGVALDALVQRDTQRRIRRVTAVTALALAAMLVMGTMTIFALNARAEADRQRAAAEGLVEFMLTDLRDRLMGVGRLDVMQAVNHRALTYYGGRGTLSELADDSLARRARILQAIGDDNLAQDDLNGALTAFSEAFETTAEQVARTPADPEKLFNHSKTHYGIGRVHELRHDWRQAERHYSTFAAAAEKLVAADPKNPSYLMKAASGAVDLGNVQLLGKNDPARAEGWYLKAVAWLTAADRLSPGDRHIGMSLANAYAWLADSFHRRCEWRSSLSARRHQHSIIASLRRADSRSEEIKFRLAAAERGLAYALWTTQQPVEAQRQLANARSHVRQLTQRDPTNAEWRKLSEKVEGDLSKMSQSPQTCQVDRA